MREVAQPRIGSDGHDPHALSTQLLAAAGACAEVRAGRSMTAALAPSAERIDADRGAVQDLAFRTMRRRGTADALLARLADRAPTGALRELVVCTLALASDPQPPYDAHTLVDQAVDAASRLPGGSNVKGFVNAILRRYLRERAALERTLKDDEVARYNHPAWWIRRVRADRPHDWAEVLDASNAPPPLTLRANRRAGGTAALLDTFAHAGLAACSMRGFDDAVVLRDPRAVDAIPGFAQGVCSVQDAAAQLAAPLLAPQPGDRVLDACAAPGGKTAHLLETADCELVALDRDERRLVRIRDTLQRIRLQADVRLGDAADPASWWDGRPFDRILADVPCTASGIVRRHPDVRWLRRPGDVAQLATQAARILDALWSVLRPGGTIVFATCSIFEQEGELQIRRFLESHPDAERRPAPGPLRPTVPGLANAGPSDAPDHDGFFYARVVRRAA